jgi:type I restriction enzyme M protein
MYEKDLVIQLGFSPKEKKSDVYSKKYADRYTIEIDFNEKAINYGKKIKCDSKTTQNFSQLENFVVLECVNRLLEKGYKPENIVLEKTWKLGHIEKGRLDILVTKDEHAYLMIECKKYGKEFEKEYKNIKKDGGQLFSYFQQDKNAELLMLYASKLEDNKIICENKIIKIEDDCRQAGSVTDFYTKWNKLAKDNGIFDIWVKPYCFESKAITINELEEIKLEDSGFIFNRFLEILRHNVVSDKGNAFNRIFTLFLCKIYDEKVNEGTDNELGFQWFNTPFVCEGIHYPKDDHRSFQIRLTDLYKNGMYEFLEKIVTDFSEAEFNNKYNFLKEEVRAPILEEFKKIRLEKNNEFAVKDVYDAQSFNDNAVVIKEIVELLQGYRLRYTRKHQYLSDFFELLLTTGLKQESGQFFTPVPVAQFIIKSLPIDTIVEQKLSSSKLDNDTLLPYIMDYAAGSGHFVTEMMHIIQRLIDSKDNKKYHPNVAKMIRKWQDDHFSWAIQYIYGIEKDYRLVKVGKVGCYLHGDGLANVIHSDGLARFDHPDYKGKLFSKDRNFLQENKQFDVVVSNPPYSVSAFRNNANKYYGKDDFELYNNLTDNSSEIECLFVERTKQLLKNGGVAGIILPSSILNNEGIYTKTREIILQYFEIIAITELGSNTFMATGTNTVVLFLRRRDNYDSIKLKQFVERFFNDFQDTNPTDPFNTIEKPVEKYIATVWNGLTFADYIDFIEKKPNETVKKHPLYKKYRPKEFTVEDFTGGDTSQRALEYAEKKLQKIEDAFWKQVINLEKEKMYYFILSYQQRIVLIKTGKKTAEKKFLGYEFSNRRGSEGIHPIQRGKTIEECTYLFDEKQFDNPEKASTYIYKAFSGDYEYPIHNDLKENIFCVRLLDMLSFDKVNFEKNISTAIVKGKIIYEDIWKTEQLVSLADVSVLKKGASITKENTMEGSIPVVAGGKEPAYFHNEANRNGNIVTVSASGAYSGFVNYFDIPIFASDCNTIQSKDEKLIPTKLIYLFLKLIQGEIYKLQRGQAQPHVYAEDLAKIKIPFPPKEIQKKIVVDIEALEKKESDIKKRVISLSGKINKIFGAFKFDAVALGDIVSFKNGLNYNRKSTGDMVNIIGVGDFQNNMVPNLNSIEQIQIEGKLSEDYILKSNDLLVVRSNGSANLVGRFLLIDNILPNTSFSGFTIRLRPDLKKVSSKYLCYYLRTENIREVLIKNSGGSNIKSLNQTLLSSLNIPLPPLSDQQKIIAQIEEIENEILNLQIDLNHFPKQKKLILENYLKI